MSARRAWAVIALTCATLWLAGCGGGPSGPPSSAECLANLDRTDVAYSQTKVDARNASCVIDTPVRVTQAAISWKPAGTLACGFALRLDTFLRDTAEPLAREHFGSSIRSMREFGTYTCKRMPSGRWSEHASGLAIDVGGFELENGTYISVEKDWRGGGAKRAFLHDLARAACRDFSVVLTPDADRDHYNHIHIDAGRYKKCGMKSAETPDSRPETDTLMADAAAD
jgi:hypothetical protein